MSGVVSLSELSDDVDLQDAVHSTSDRRECSPTVVQVFRDGQPPRGRVSRRAEALTMNAHISYLWRGVRLSATLADAEVELRSSSFSPFPRSRSFAPQGGESNAEHLKAWFTHSPLLQPENKQAIEHGPNAARLHGRPSITALQRNVSIESHLSRISPTHPRSLAQRLSRATPSRHATARAGDPGSADCELLLFPDSSPNQVRWVPFQKMQLLPWERGASRHFVQECPESGPGKYKQEKTQWHSTPTKSR